MTQILVMKVNIHNAKTHLSRYVEELERTGKPIILCRRNVPVAELRPLRKVRTQPRRIGLAAGRFTVSDEFFEPLPEALLASFHGHTAPPEE